MYHFDRNVKKFRHKNASIITHKGWKRDEKEDEGSNRQRIIQQSSRNSQGRHKDYFIEIRQGKMMKSANMLLHIRVGSEMKKKMGDLIDRGLFSNQAEIAREGIRTVLLKYRKDKK